MSRETDIRAINAENLANDLKKRVEDLEQKAQDLERFIREFWEVYQDEKTVRKK